MPNPLFGMFGNRQPSYSPLNGMDNLLQQFNQFKSSFQGNPQQRVQELLNSGRMSQEQFNRLSEMARQIQRMTGGH